MQILHKRNMESPKRQFNTTPLCLSRREREGNALSSTYVKEMMYGHRMSNSQSLFKLDLRGHYGCVNAIEFSSDGELIASGGDDRRLLLWNVGQTVFNAKSPTVIETLHISNINTCCFNAENKKIATGGNDGQVIIHDFNVQESTAVYGLSEAIYALSPDPVNSTIIATASDDGKARILDTRMSTDSAPFVLADLKAAMHSITYNPMDPRLLATANSKHGLGLWDIRMPFMSLSYKSVVYNCMSVRFNTQGDRLLALRRRSSPVLFDIAKMQPMFEFDYKTYYNACTLKSCSFAGLHEEYVMSGSDDCCVYLWKIPSDTDYNFTQTEPHMILRGHRSIVNQVRYCPQNQFIISSGVEKLIKLWSPYALPKSTGHLKHSRRYGDDEEVERDAYSHEEYIHMVLHAGSFLSHDYTNGNTEEEPCMIAFFDSLIQREVEHSIELDESASSSSSSSSCIGDDDDDDSSDRGGARASGNKKKMFRYDSDAASDDPSTSSTVLGSEAAAARHSPARQVANSPARPGTSPTSRAFMDLGTSSDSDSEVEEILSAMYSRYMNSRERIMSGESKPSGKKISAIIARGKQKCMSSKRSKFQRRLMRIREDVQHSGDQYLRDSANSIGILVDVIDNFVDNLVAGESNGSRSLTDIRDGLTDSASGFSGESNARPDDLAFQTLFLETERSPETSPTESSQQSQSVATSLEPLPVPETLRSFDTGMYFMPELQAFAPESFNAVAQLDPLLPPRTMVVAENTSVGTIGPGQPLGKLRSEENALSETFPFQNKALSKCCAGDGANTSTTMQIQKKCLKSVNTCAGEQTGALNSVLDNSDCLHKTSSVSRLSHLRSTVSSTSPFPSVPLGHNDHSGFQSHEIPAATIETHFKKSKVNRKNVRMHRPDSQSSSEDEER